MIIPQFEVCGLLVMVFHAYLFLYGTIQKYVIGLDTYMVIREFMCFHSIWNSVL